MTQFNLTKYLVSTITGFPEDRTIRMCFDKPAKPLVPFNSGLPQGSPLSHVLYILSVSALISGHSAALRTGTTYVDNVVITHGAGSVPEACTCPRTRRDTMAQSESYLHIRLAPHKWELMHIIPTTSTRNPNTPDN